MPALCSTVEVRAPGRPRAFAGSIFCVGDGGHSDFARDDLAAELLEPRSEVVDEATAGGKVQAAVGEIKFAGSRCEVRYRVFVDERVGGAIVSLDHRGQDVRAPGVARHQGPVLVAVDADGPQLSSQVAG
jgi:hypothetical protein